MIKIIEFVSEVSYVLWLESMLKCARTLLFYFKVCGHAKLSSELRAWGFLYRFVSKIPIDLGWLLLPSACIHAHEILSHTQPNKRDYQRPHISTHTDIN